MKLLNAILCSLFGHRYVVERVLNSGARKVGCTRCRKSWGMHDSTRSFIPWDAELESLYSPGGILSDGDKP